jgi:hypothetical protein
MNGAQFTRDRIQNFHLQQHAIVPSITNSAIPTIFGSGFVLIIYADPHILPDRIKRQNYKDFLENNKPDFLADTLLIIL